MDDTCTLDGSGNAEMDVEGLRVELLGSATLETGMAMEDFHPVWTTQMNLDFDISTFECDHHLHFAILEPAVGVLSVGSLEGGTFGGLYDGYDREAHRIAAFSGESTLTISAYSDSSVSGSFELVLKDGTVISGGTFLDVPIR